VSCADQEVTGYDVRLVTNRVDWSAAKIISLSRQRWPPNTCYQDRTGW
jgi:hypothetical protein